MWNKVLRRTGKDVWVGCQGFYEVDPGKELPTAKAFCKHCAREIAKPIAFVSFNCKLGIVVECEKCHDRYVLYEDKYIQYYVGRHTEFGFIPPTHGKNIAIPRNVADKMNEAKAKRHEENSESLCQAFGVSRDKLEEMREGWAKEREASYKKFERELAEFRAGIADRQIADESARRKLAIERGAKYDPIAGGLTDPITGEFFKIKK